MNYGKLFILPMLALLLTGCFKEDYSFCPPEGDNVTLTFSFTEGGATVNFSDKIHTVDVCLYNVDNKFVMHRVVEKNALDQFPGLRLTLAQGEYRVVCWGNVADHSRFCQFTPGVTTLEDCTVEIDPAAGDTGDPIYYAPYKTHPCSRAGGVSTRAPGDYAEYTVMIPRFGSVVKNLEFVRAHRTINVYVKGLNDGGLHPLVEASQLWARYDFLFVTQPYRRNFSQTSQGVSTPVGAILLASFHHAFGDIDNTMEITIKKSSDQSVAHTIDLRQFLIDNPLADKNDIDILVTFSIDVGATISVPSWSGADVTPGID